MFKFYCPQIPVSTVSIDRNKKGGENMKRKFAAAILACLMTAALIT